MLRSSAKRPGWTTPAELAFAASIVENMTSQVASLQQLQTNLLKASQMVGPQEVREA